MLTIEQARTYVNEMSWPPGAARPYVRMRLHADGSYHVLLHETIRRGWSDVVCFSSLAPEAALARALEGWIEHHAMACPALDAEIKRLSS